MGLFLQLLVVRGDTFDFVDNKGKLLPKDDLVTWVFKGKDKLVCNFPRGTYYLRVGSYYTTGYYTLKWNIKACLKIHFHNFQIRSRAVITLNGQKKQKGE